MRKHQVKKATCKDCLHYDTCFLGARIVGKTCRFFANKAEWVHLPCKVGDEVFIIIEDDEHGDFISGGIVVSVSYQNECWIFVRYEFGLTYHHTTYDIGKNLFFTKEEAEKVLKQMEKL